MTIPSFSKWFPWTQREDYEGIKYPGIYVIALSSESLGSRSFDWRKGVVYIGMSNAVHGLKGRLRQFHNTIKMTRPEHGGAERFLHAHRDYTAIVGQLFVALFHIPCNPAKPASDDLRKMGEVTKAEYDAQADYYDIFQSLPQFNDKRRSPKFKFQ